MRTPRRLAVGIVASCLLPGVVTAGVRGTEEPAVRPGGLVRWVGQGTEVCTLAGQSWEPIGSTCVYPIDLLTPEGPVMLERRRGGRQERVTLRVGEYPYATQRLTIHDERRVHLSKKDLARVERENALLDTIWQRRMTPRFTLPLGHPLASMPDGGRFGARRIINGEPHSPHTGVDYAAPKGTPVLAAADGTVALARELFFSGNSVLIDHGDGLVTMYFHLSTMLVRAGERVERGQRIGLVGSTGRATGPHLHFGVRWHGARVDPALLFEGLDDIPAVGP
jgi:hypothetical protein